MNPDAINHLMQMVVGFKSFVIRIAEEQAVFTNDSDFRCQCACHTVNLNMRGSGSFSTNHETENDNNVGSMGNKSISGNVMQRFSRSRGAFINNLEDISVEGRQLEELEESAMAVSFGQDDDVGDSRINVLSHNEGNASLSVGIGVGIRSDGLDRIGVVDPSRNNFCRPVLEVIGSDQSVDEIHLQVVLNLGSANNDADEARGTDVPLAQPEGRGWQGSKEQDSTSRLVSGNCHSTESLVSAVPSSSERVESSLIPIGYMHGNQVTSRRREGDCGHVEPGDFREDVSQGKSASTIERLLAAIDGGRINMQKKIGRPPKCKVIVKPIMKNWFNANSVDERWDSQTRREDLDEAGNVWRIRKALGMIAEGSDNVVIGNIAAKVGGF
ncbi:hypothetical protein Dimus_013827 [Dionaea muscipula]